jgi:hypothetical protein
MGWDTTVIYCTVFPCQAVRHFFYMYCTVRRTKDFMAVGGENKNRAGAGREVGIYSCDS